MKKGSLTTRLSTVLEIISSITRTTATGQIRTVDAHRNAETHTEMTGSIPRAEVAARTTTILTVKIVLVIPTRIAPATLVLKRGSRQTAARLSPALTQVLHCFNRSSSESATSTTTLVSLATHSTRATLFARNIRKTRLCYPLVQHRKAFGCNIYCQNSRASIDCNTGRRSARC